jgi:N-dimethylarginine dimethylaminohydrolase
VSAPACDASPACGAPGTSECVFRVAWQINPHMRAGAAEPREAIRQHDAFVRHLRSLGAIVDAVPFVHGAYDSVFAKDSAVLGQRNGAHHALLAHPRYPQRAAEQRARGAALASRGFRMADPPLAPLEGGDVVVPDPSSASTAYLGYGFRSVHRSADALARFLDRDVTPLELRDPSLYHLDMAVAVLGDVTFVYEDALTPRAMRDLSHAAGAGNVVRVTRAEAQHFALNFVALGGPRRDVVLASGAPAFEERLRSHGYVPHPLPLSQFHLAGGSAACLVARIHPLERVAVRTTAAIRSTAA